MSRRLTRAFLWSAGLLAVGALAVLVAVPVAIRSVVTPAFVAARASSNLGREVSVGAVGLHFTPLLRIRLEQVAIAPDVTLGSVDVGIHFMSLLEREIETALVEVEDARLTLVRRADGGMELRGALPEADLETREGGEDPKSAVPPALPRLPRIDLRRVNVVFVDHAVADPPLRIPFEVRRLELEPVATGERPSLSVAVAIGEEGEGGLLTLEGELGPLEAEASTGEQPVRALLHLAAVAPAPLIPYLAPNLDVRRLEGSLEGSVALEGRLAGELSADLSISLVEGGVDLAGVDLSRPRFEGRLDRGDALAVETGRLTSEGLSFAGRHAEDLRASFAFADDALEIESLDLRAYDGTVHQEGRLVLGEVPSFDFRVEAAGVDAGRLAGMAVEGADPTLLEGEAAIQGHWTDQPNRLEPIRGDGRVLLHGGVLPSQNLLTAVSRSLLRLVPGSSHLLRENPRLARLEQATSTFRVEEGRVKTDDLQVRTDDFLASGRGSVGHELDLDFKLDVALTSRGVHKAFALPQVREEYHEAARLPAVPVKVSGRVEIPSFRANASGVPIATLRGVLGLSGRAGALTRGVVGTARDAAGAVGGGLVHEAQRLRPRSEPSEPTPGVLP